jgi:hypothetical protein
LHAGINIGYRGFDSPTAGFKCKSNGNFMAEEQADDPLERILNASNREHLDNPFKTHHDLRAKHFPGAGKKLSHSRLVRAYLAERDVPNPDWQLLAHGTWPWIIGHAHDITSLSSELEHARKAGEPALGASKRKSYVDKYSESGTAEIEVFLRIFANGGADFQKAVMERLESAPSSATPTSGPTTPKPISAPAASPESSSSEPPKPSVEDLDPITRARMAMIGTVFFLVLSFIPLGIQYWRQPDQGHEIVLGITGILTVLTIVCVVDYFRKKP